MGLSMVMIVGVGFIVGGGFGFILSNWFLLGWIGFVNVIVIVNVLLFLCVVNVYDGDIICICVGEWVCIENIDVLEMLGSLKCEDLCWNGWCDYVLVECSCDELVLFFVGGLVIILCDGIDCYGCMLVRLSVNGWDVGDYFVLMGLVRVWW